MVGLGETEEEVFQAMVHLRKADVDFLTVGQYLRPSGGTCRWSNTYTRAVRATTG